MNRPSDYLVEMSRRRILGAVKDAKWTAGNDGVVIPYWDALDGKPLARRWWGWGKKRTWGKDGKHPRATLYCTPQTDWQVSMYLVEGETSLMALYSAGIYHAVALFGANQTKNTGEVFAKRGVRRVIMICDNDAAGVMSAIRMRDELAAHNIYFEARSLAEHVPEKGDVGDLRAGMSSWIDFRQMIRLSSVLSLPVKPSPKPPKPTYETDSDLVRNIVDEACRQSPSEKYSRDNKNLTMRSPLRKDKNPSFTINTETGQAYDFATGESWSPRKLAQELGVETASFRQAPVTSVRSLAQAPVMVAEDVAVLERLRASRLFEEVPTPDVAKAESLGFPLSASDISGMFFIDSGSSAIVTLAVIEALEAGDLSDTFSFREINAAVLERVDVSDRTVRNSISTSPFIHRVLARKPLESISNKDGRPAELYELDLIRGREILSDSVDENTRARDLSDGQSCQNRTAIRFQYDADELAMNENPLTTMRRQMVELDIADAVTKTTFRAWWLRQHMEQKKLHAESNNRIEQATGIRRDSVRRVCQQANYAIEPIWGIAHGDRVEEAAADARRQLRYERSNVTNYIEGGGIFVKLQSEYEWKWIKPSLKHNMSDAGWITRTRDELKEVTVQSERFAIATGARVFGCSEAEYCTLRDKQRAKRKQNVMMNTDAKKPQLPKMPRFIIPDKEGYSAEWMALRLEHENIMLMYSIALDRGYEIRSRRIYKRGDKLAIDGEYTLDKIEALPVLDKREDASDAYKQWEESGKDIPF